MTLAETREPHSAPGGEGSHRGSRGTRRLHFDLEPTPASVTEGRRAVAEALRKTDVTPDARDEVLLLVSEVLTNAVLHGSPPTSIAIELADHRIWVAVADGAEAAQPEVHHPAPSDTSGRGVQLVDTLAHRWGVEPLPAGKRVWFESCW